MENIKDSLYKRIFDQISRYSKNSLQTVINGTGIVLHTGLGRSPIDKKILSDTIENIYPYTNLEFNVDDNSRGERNTHISSWQVFACIHFDFTSKHFEHTSIYT